MPELHLDGVQIREDVGVVEFQIVEQCHFGPVMDKLRAFVEERRVVFVGFNHEPFATAQARRRGKIARDATDEIAGRAPGGLKEPGDEAGRGRFAMGAGDCNHPASTEDMLRHPLGARGIRNPRVQHRLHQWVATAEGITDHHHVGLDVERARIPAFGERDPGIPQKVAHRRVYLRVRAADLMAQFACQHCQTGHERAADAQNVQTHA